MLYLLIGGVENMDNKYYLAIEKAPNNYFPINLLDLNISSNFTTYKIEELDNFTLKYTKKEILNSIKEANLLNITSNMNLVIIYSEKNVIRKSAVLTKDNYYDMWEYIKKNYENKEFINKIYNFLASKINTSFLEEIKNPKNINNYLATLTLLPYFTQRKLYLYLYEK